MRHMCTVSLATLLLLGCASKGATTKTENQAPATAATAGLSTEERDRLVKDLEETRRAFLASVQGLSEAQLRFRAAPDRWSVAEVAEHIAVSEQGIFSLITDKILRAPAPPDLRAQAPRDDESIRRAVADRSNKRQAPETLRPTGRFPTVAATVTAFTEGRDRTLEFARTTKEDLRGHGFAHPVMNLLDGYQWMLLLSAHCARHTAQIEEVKASPGFPRS